ncbi:Rad52/22 family double-strand break repair protein-domain-containing protein [Endogone sp. FLAS-F59071]|nr:Rad52/22 family double-strand break repair protein-domain-containing protein [Endogone sp. FLAS-F59071]|eukprot:RUS17787.1 Rad52/22 family double-strand break repair protein-domain-containing protein [Endogone sp. FLAS-F59071]
MSRPITPFTPEERERIEKLLGMHLAPRYIQIKPPGYPYIPGDIVNDLLNHIFGAFGWSFEIKEYNKDFEGETERGYSVGIYVNARITLRDGTFHDGVGYGVARNQREEGSAYELAWKAGETDAMKRAAQHFGRVFNVSDNAFQAFVKSHADALSYKGKLVFFFPGDDNESVPRPIAQPHRQIKSNIISKAA